jgi:Divergent InlB B-repeat domain
MMRQAAALAAALAVAFALGCGSDNDAPTTPVVGTKTVAITAGQGSGRVTSSNNKIDCRFTNGAASGTCSAAFDSGSTATLTATPDAGNEFVAWSGDCTGATCQLSVTRDVTASPRFVATQGELTVELTTPNADDGAILFVVSGPSVLAVTPAVGVEMLENRTTANGTTTSTILLRGNLASGAVGKVAVRGLDLDGAYTAQMVQAAARASGGYSQRTDLSAYRVTLRR